MGPAAQSGQPVIRQEKAVGENEENELGELSEDFAKLRPQERLAAGQDEERDAELPGFPEQTAHVVRAHFRGLVAGKGLGIAAAAGEVAAVRDAVDDDGGNLDAPLQPVRPAPGRYPQVP